MPVIISACISQEQGQVSYIIRVEFKRNNRFNMETMLLSLQRYLIYKFFCLNIALFIVILCTLPQAPVQDHVLHLIIVSF